LLWDGDYMLTKRPVIENDSSPEELRKVRSIKGGEGMDSSLIAAEEKQNPPQQQERKEEAAGSLKNA